MSILAEPRRKQRISVDPQNLQWRDDDNKISKKMMEKMGWKDGKGLGRDAHGNVDAVKLKANHSGKGLGADKMASYDSTWIGHHDDFADLLAALNKNKPKEDETEEDKKDRADKISIELSSKSVRRRIHYQKFTRMKDTANYSEQDKSAVLGVGLKRTKDESSEAKKENAEVDQGNTTVSTLSVGDYFAQKMAALKAKSTSVEAKKEEVEEDEEYGQTVVNQSFNSFAFSYDEQPVKMEEDEDEPYGRNSFNQNFSFSYESQEVNVKIEEAEEEKVEDEEEVRRRRKAEKKLRKQQKKAEEAAMEESVKEEKAEEEMTEKQRRKMEKRLRKQMERELNAEAVAEEEVAEEEPPKKKKKRCEVEEEITESEKPKKKKKNKD